MTIEPETCALAESVLVRARKIGFRLATAESCTGGLIAAALTEIPGSSDVFDRGFVTYSNEAKSEMIGVPANMIDENGAVSGNVAAAMAEGAIANSQADIAVAVTGVAGPAGGSPEKPVGLVWFGLAVRNQEAVSSCQLFGDKGRTAIRKQTVLEALRMLDGALRENI